MADNMKETIQRRIEEIQAEQRQLEVRYAQNQRVLSELQELLRQLEAPSENA